MVSKRPRVIVRGIGCFSVSVTLSPQSSLRQRKPFTNERKKIMESRKNKPKIRVAQCYSRAERSLRVRPRPDHEILRILQNRGTWEDEGDWNQVILEDEDNWNQVIWEDEDNWSQGNEEDEDNWNQRIEEYPNLENWADEDLWDPEAVEIGLMKPLREGDSIDLVGFMDDDWDKFLSASSASVEGGDSPDEDEDEYLTAPSDFEEDPNLENWADEDVWHQDAVEIGLMKLLREGDSIDLVGFMDDDWDEFLSASSASVEGGDSPDEDEDEYLTAPSDFEEDIGKDEDEGGIFERLRLTLIRKIREVVGLCIMGPMST